MVIILLLTSSTRIVLTLAKDKTVLHLLDGDRGGEGRTGETKEGLKRCRMNDE